MAAAVAEPTGEDEQDPMPKSRMDEVLDEVTDMLFRFEKICKEPGAGPRAGAGAAEPEEPEEPADAQGARVFDTDGVKSHPGSWRDAVRRDWRELRVAPYSVRNDREAILGAVAQDEQALSLASPSLRADRGFVIEAVRVRGGALRHAAAELRADHGVVLEAVAQDWLALRHADEAVRADPAVVAESMRLSGHTFESHTQELAVAVPVVRQAGHSINSEVWDRKVRRDWRKLAEAPLAVRGDRELVLGAVHDSWGEALQFAAEELRADRALVLEAVRLRGSALQHASQELQGDREVVRAAVQQEWQAFEFATEEARADRELATEALIQHIDALQFVAESLRGDSDFMLQAVRQSGCAIRFASEELRGDVNIALEAFMLDNMSLRWMSKQAQEYVWAATRDPDPCSRRTTTRWLDVAARAPPAANGAAIGGPTEVAASAQAPPQTVPD